MSLIRNSRGYTLIEALIALAMFSLMVFLGTMALDQSLRQYQGLLGKGLGLWEFTKRIWVGKSLGSMVNYYVPLPNGQWAPYFIGDQSTLSYVSLAPLAGKLPVAVWIKQEQDASNKRRLVYYEVPVYTKRAADFERDEVFGDFKRGTSLPIVEGADSIRFAFLVFNLNLKKYLWVEEFNGRQNHVLPTQVKITITKNSRDEDQLFTVHTNGLDKMLYGEIFRYPE